MLEFLFAPLADQHQFFNLFSYITFRAGGALMTALIICFLIGQPIINWLKARQKDGQPIREDGPESHLLTKKGTPTMGGAMMLISLSIATLLWVDLTEDFIWCVMFVTFGYGVLGFLDDYKKLVKRSSDGLSGRQKLAAQFIIAGLAVWMIMLNTEDSIATNLYIPFFKDVVFNLGYFYLVLGAIVIVGSSNSVNLTDGLDGLAIVPIMIAIMSFAIICYVVGRSDFSDYLQINHVLGTAELTIVCAAIVGAGMGFLWFNAPPAAVFMGDTGSLSLGGAIGAIAVIAKHELVLLIIGGLFVVEALSVIIQVGSFKLTGKRVFLMAPIHHHFEKLGWKEPTIVIRFWIIAAILALIGLATLKIR